MKRRRRRIQPDLLETLPPLSDEAAVALTEFFAELAYRLDGKFLGQILRYRNQQREDSMQHRSATPPGQTDLLF
jgi:hypothetical protein